MNELTYEQALRMPKLVEIAQFAEKAEKAIRENYISSFGINKDEIQVYSDSAFGEYYCSATLTLKGVWRFHDNWWGGRDYELMCTGADIYAHYANQMILKERGEDDNTMDCALSEFKKWVKGLPTWKEES